MSEGTFTVEEWMREINDRGLSPLARRVALVCLGLACPVTRDERATALAGAFGVSARKMAQTISELESAGLVLQRTLNRRDDLLRYMVKGDD